MMYGVYGALKRRTDEEDDVLESQQQMMLSFARKARYEHYNAPKKFVDDFDLIIKRLDNTFKSHTGGIKKKLKTLREYRYKIQRLFSSVGQAQMMDLNSELNIRIGEIQHEFGVLNALLDMQEVLARNEETLMVQSIINILYLLAKSLRSSSQLAFNILTVAKEEEPKNLQVDQNSAVVKALDKIIERLSNTCRWYSDIIKEELERVREISLKIQPLLSAATTQLQILDLNWEFNKLMRKIDDDIKNLNVLLDVFEFIQPEEEEKEEEEQLARNEEETIGKGKGLCCKCALKIDSNEIETNCISA